MSDLSADNAVRKRQKRCEAPVACTAVIPPSGVSSSPDAEGSGNASDTDNNLHPLLSVDYKLVVSAPSTGLTPDMVNFLRWENSVIAINGQKVLDPPVPKKLWGCRGITVFRLLNKRLVATGASGPSPGEGNVNVHLTHHEKNDIADTDTCRQHLASLPPLITNEFDIVVFVPSKGLLPDIINSIVQPGMGIATIAVNGQMVYGTPSERAEKLQDYEGMTAVRLLSFGANKSEGREIISAKVRAVYENALKRSVELNCLNERCVRAMAAGDHANSEAKTRAEKIKTDLFISEKVREHVWFVVNKFATVNSLMEEIRALRKRLAKEEQEKTVVIQALAAAMQEKDDAIEARDEALEEKEEVLVGTARLLFGGEYDIEILSTTS